jgi:hypothetical protein
VVALIGEEAARKLFAELAGSRIYFRRFDDTGWRESKTFRRLVEVVGRDRALKLWQWCARGCLEIPRQREQLRSERNRQIIAAYSRGVSVDVLVRQYELSRRQIFYILKLPSESL